MIPFKIGNWLITTEGINWEGKPETEYFLPKDTLTESGFGERSKMYDWLIQIPQKTWITETDTYALNTAFMYAADCFGLDLNAGYFVNTLMEQQKSVLRK